VTGVETSAEAVVHAAKAYRSSNLRFVRGDARLLPLHDASVDAVVSFETIEHFDGQDRFLTEVRRVLRPGGCLIVSTPDRDIYSPSGSPANPFHACELSRIEFSRLLHKFFAHVHLMGQRAMLGSALISDGPARALWTFERRGSGHFEATAGLPRSVYVVAVASDELADVPDSVFIETDGIQAMLAPPRTAAEDEARAELESMRAQVAAARTETEAALADLAATREVTAELEARLKESAEMRTELADRLGEKEAETARLTAELEARLKESAARAERASSVLRAELEKEQADRTTLDQALFQARETITELTRQNAAHAAHHVALLSQLEEVHNSKSWRWTEPLRNAHKTLSVGFRRLLRRGPRRSGDVIAGPSAAQQRSESR
jgi:hypothetical protein